MSKTIEEVKAYLQQEKLDCRNNIKDANNSDILFKTIMNIEICIIDGMLEWIEED